MIKKLHPHICFFLFDIPPQSYVCEQYLTAVFPGSVVSYRTTRELDSIPEPQEGKIFIFGASKFPLIRDLKADLFWNAASFQEMEPHVVDNYLKYVNGQAAGVFLLQMMDGKEVAEEPGRPGVLEQTTLDHYKKALTNFKLLDLSPCQLPTGALRHRYSTSFWTRADDARSDVREA